MSLKIQRNQKRTSDQLQKQYEVEKCLANKLRNAGKEERRHLYTVLYDELYRRILYSIPKKDEKSRLRKVSRELRFLKRFLEKDFTFLEVGAGDCSLTLEVSKRVRKVYAVDVSKKINENNVAPENFELIISNACIVQLPEKGIDVIYSNQLMEHLHPDDAFDCLQNIYKMLVCRGKYICITPNRLSGPHDISKYFDEIASGFHLNEYTVAELCNLIREAGFSKVNVYIGIRGFYIRFSLLLIVLFEKFFGCLPFPLRKILGRMLLFKQFLSPAIVAIK